MSALSSRPGVIAVLGPTNTGKTFLAIERMLGHASGMIGFPLRLLARENYDRVVALKGAGRVALVTGEEKIIPPGARYFLCTVESMPLDRPVEFLAIDEIQMCADEERGHIFTDRLLRARGLSETMLLGAETMRPVIRRLVPGVEFVSRPRLSKLSHAGVKKVNRLPRRSAIVAFTANDVYMLAEMLRQRRGGAAVVLGALSPRTRNAQVAMYQAGEVDYLVATDAIGMGLNMDISHVWFGALNKFDGRIKRRLHAAEVAQIAGRAGRHLSDGTFGTLGAIGPIQPELVEAVESHSFAPVTAIAWRNSALDFTTPQRLLRAIEAPPPADVLKRARQADDHAALAHMVGNAEVMARATSPAAVRLLWDVCQIPDFRKTLAEAHTRMLVGIYLSLVDHGGRLSPDWMAGQLHRLDRSDGDIETLMTRIAHVRTLTYVAHRGDWLDDALHWQERARRTEDRLSDALHERLTHRFVDRRAAMLSRLSGKKSILTAVNRRGDVLVEGAFVGRLAGFRFQPDAASSGEARRVLMAAASRALQGEIAARVQALAAAPDGALALDDGGVIAWRDEAVAALVRGPQPIAPTVRVLASELLSATQREAVRRRLAAWLDGHIASVLAPLDRLRRAPLTGAARGLAFQLVEGLGSLTARAARNEVAALRPDDRRALARLGVRLGTESVFVAPLLKPGAADLRALLWAVHAEAKPPCPAPPPGRVSIALQGAERADFLEATGFRAVGGYAIRFDILERLVAALRDRSRDGGFRPLNDLCALTGIPRDALLTVAAGLGFRAALAEDGVRFVRPRRTGQTPHGAAGHAAAREAAERAPSPFAVLRSLRLP